MKKKILSIALILCMLIAVLPTATILQAATPTGTALTQDNIGSYTNLTGGSTESEMAYFYLSENVDVYQTLTVTGYVTLDLNGKALQQTAVPGQQFLGVTILIIGTDDNSGYLTITDSCGEGKIDIKYYDDMGGDTHYCFSVVNGSATLNSGEIVTRQHPSFIGIHSNASMTINGGKINSARNVFYNSGILCANGGTVTANYANNANTGKITRTDGVITATTFEYYFFDNYGEINWGIFEKSSDIYGVYNYGTISGGIFNCEIRESGTITGGLFKTAPSGYETWDVTFKPENGEADAAYKAVKNTTITPLTAPVKNGFTFAGWYEKENGKFKANAFDFANTKVTEDITLYAKWVCAGEHTGGTANCTHKAVCTSCGEEYGEINSANHDFTAQVKNSGTLKSSATCQDKALYYYSCSRCGEIEKSDNHTFKGELNSSKHTKALGDWQSNGDGHWKTYICCPNVKALEGSHTYEWKSGNGQYWQRCSDCGHETAKKNIPEITISGADKVCRTQDYTFTATLFEGAVNATYSYDNGFIGNGGADFDVVNGVYTATISSKITNEVDSFTVTVNAETSDGYTVSVTKTVAVQKEHIGGTATCKKQAECSVCGTPYGDVNPDNHTDEKEWSTKNETQHKQTWKCCGAVEVALENHEWKNGVCEECGYICLHTGGTADCTHKAVCDACGEEYGEVDSGNHDLENIKGNAATVTEKGNTEYWHCKNCDKYFSDKDGKNEIDLKDTVIGKLPPEIIDGKGQSLTEGEKRELSFRSNAAFGDFIRVELDGEALDGENYTVKEGSTVVTLNADYVAALSAGEHTLGIVSESGTAEAAFTVNAKVVDTNSPQTGDNNHIALWIALFLVSGVGLFGTIAYRRRKGYSAK